jgi:hypothetical protein
MKIQSSSLTNLEKSAWLSQSRSIHGDGSQSKHSRFRTSDLQPPKHNHRHHPTPMDSPSNQPPPTPPDTLTTTTTLLKPTLPLAILLLITTWLTIRSSSQPGGILHGARVWSRNIFYTRTRPQSLHQDIAEDDSDSDDDAPYGVPGIFDSHPSPSALRTESSKQDTTDDFDGDGDGEDDTPYGPGIYDKPIPSL